MGVIGFIGAIGAIGNYSYYSYYSPYSNHSNHRAYSFTTIAIPPGPTPTEYRLRQPVILSPSQ